MKVKTTASAEWSFVDVEREEYPFLILLPIVRMPDELSGYRRPTHRGAVANRFWIRGASFKEGITQHLDTLASRLGVAAIEPTGTASVPEFFQMLAKIGHAYATAELGLGSFSPFLVAMICNSDLSNSSQYIGGLQYTEAPSNGLHDLTLDSHTCNRPDIIAVKIRLLMPLGTPTYYVAVGYQDTNINNV